MPEMTCIWCHEGFGEDEAEPIVINKRTDPMYLHEECIKTWLFAVKGGNM